MAAAIAAMLGDCIIVCPVGFLLCGFRDSNSSLDGSFNFGLDCEGRNLGNGSGFCGGLSVSSDVAFSSDGVWGSFGSSGVTVADDLSALTTIRGIL